MNSVVVIPAFNRPEMLAVCLKRVLQTNDLPQIFGIALENDYDPLNLVVLLHYGFRILDYFSNGARLGTGNSGNIMRGLAAGLLVAEQTGAEIIHLLEEDCWVGRDYFSAHEAIHKQFKPWAVSLCRNQHRRIEPTQDPALVYMSQCYQSIGVSFPLDSVREILVHNTPDYFADMEGYLRMMFPNSRYGGLFPEQDGLIARIIEKEKYDVVYSNVARAYHAGFYSYHRAGQEPEGTLDEKIAQLEAMSEEEMNRRSIYKDIKFCNLEGFHVKEFVLE